MCKEKERLWKVHKIAFDIYVRSTSELAEAAGIMASEDFEFLQSRLEDAKLFLLSARQNLNEHTAKHGC